MGYGARRLGVLLAFVVAAMVPAATAHAQQPDRIDLSSTTRKVFPPIDAPHFTQVFGSPYHTGADTYAVDLAAGCFATDGKRLYAPMSGTVFIQRTTGYGNTVVIADLGSTLR